MRTRREVLMLSGAGVTAIALPTFGFPGFGLAQGSVTGRGGAAAAARLTGPDPMLAEIMRQFQRMHTGISAVPPRGNAQQAAAAFRMLAAWGRANNIDAQLKQAVTDAVALDGHHELVSKLSSFDWVADAKKRGIALPPNFFNPTYEDFAKAIGFVKGGFSVERLWRSRARKIEKNADRFNRQLALLNGRQPDARIRLIQDGDDVDGDGLPDSIDGYDDREQDQDQGEPDCKPNPDGSWACVLTNPQVVPEPEGCDEAKLFGVFIAVSMGLFCLVYAWICAFGYVAQGLWGYFLYMADC